MQDAFGVLAGILQLVATVPYLRDILRGSTKPQRATMAPEVIVEQVSANANWNTQNASSGTPVDP